jgi:histone H3/H4
MRIVFEGPDRNPTKPLTAAEARKVIEARKKGPNGEFIETLYHTVERLSRHGELRSAPPREKPKRILSTAGIRAALRKRGYLCGEGTVEEMERAVSLLIDFAVHIARIDKRKTIKPGDVSGTNAVWIEASGRGRKKS